MANKNLSAKQAYNLPTWQHLLAWATHLITLTYSTHLQGILFADTTTASFHRMGLPTTPIWQYLVTWATHQSTQPTCLQGISFAVATVALFNRHAYQSHQSDNTLLPGQPTAITSVYSTCLQRHSLCSCHCGPVQQNRHTKHAIQQHLITWATYYHHYLLKSFIRHSLCSHLCSPIPQNRPTNYTNLATYHCLDNPLPSPQPTQLVYKAFLL